jgi:hypothetical protein
VGDFVVVNAASLTLDGKLYALADLPQVAHDTLVSLQFVEARLRELHDEMAVSQTAHVAYARALKAELDQTSSMLSSITPSP